MNASSEPESTASQREFFRLGRASQLADVSVRTVRRAIEMGLLRAFRPTGASRGVLLVRRRDVIDWVERSAIKPPSARGRL
jgi:hypothetical protein